MICSSMWSFMKWSAHMVEAVLDKILETTSTGEISDSKIFCSARVGRIVMAAGAKLLTQVILELGGKRPAVGY
ncbi:hypothetical protein RYX36_031550 [Vicia faba]